MKNEAQESNQVIKEAQFIGKKKKFITSPCKHGIDNRSVNLFQLYLYQKCLFLQSVLVHLPIFRCPFYVALRWSELLDSMATCQRFWVTHKATPELALWSRASEQEYPLVLSILEHFWARQEKPCFARPMETQLCLVWSCLLAEVVRQCCEISVSAKPGASVHSWESEVSPALTSTHRLSWLLPVFQILNNINVNCFARGNTECGSQFPEIPQAKKFC